jgi:hypothetical protein
MAYGVKYRMDFQDIYQERDYRLDILEKDYTDDIIQLEQLSSTPVEIEYRGSEDAFQEPIYASFMRVKLMAQSQTQFRDLVQEDQFKHLAQLKTDIGGTYQVVWDGIHLPDIYTEVFTDPPFEIDLKFTDGFGQLKEIEYTPIPTNSFRHNARDILEQCVNKLPDPIERSIFEYLDIHEARTDLDLSDDLRPDRVLAQHYIDEGLFKADERTEEDSAGNTTKVQEYQPCFEVIKQIAKAFQAKIFKGGFDFSNDELAYKPSFRMVGINLFNSRAKLFGVDADQIASTANTLKVDNNQKLRPSTGQVNFRSEPVLVDQTAQLQFYLAASQAIYEYEGSPKKKNIIPNGDFNYPDTNPNATDSNGNSLPGLFRQVKWSDVGATTAAHGWSNGLPGLKIQEGELESDTERVDANKVRLQAKVALDFDLSNVPTAQRKAAHNFIKRSSHPFSFYIELSVPNSPTFETLQNKEEANANGYPTKYNTKFEFDGSSGTCIVDVEPPEFTIEFDADFDVPFDGDLTAKIKAPGDIDFVDRNNRGTTYTIKVSAIWEFMRLTNEDAELDAVNKRNNSKVDNNANTSDQTSKVKLSDSAIGNDAGALIIKDGNGDFVGTKNWEKDQTLKYSQTLPHLKLLAREYLHQWEVYRRKLKGTMTFANQMLFSQNLIISEDGNEYDLPMIFHRWDVRNFLVDFEAMQGIGGESKITPLDPDDNLFDNPREGILNRQIAEFGRPTFEGDPNFNIELINGTDNYQILPNDGPLRFETDNISASFVNTSLPLISDMDGQLLEIFNAGSNTELVIIALGDDAFPNGSNTLALSPETKVKLGYDKANQLWLEV